MAQISESNRYLTWIGNRNTSANCQMYHATIRAPRRNENVKEEIHRIFSSFQMAFESMVWIAFTRLSYYLRLFLAMLVALHFTPVSESVSGSYFRTSVASRLASLLPKNGVVGR